MTLEEIQAAILKSDLSAFELDSLMHYILGTLQVRIVEAEKMADRMPAAELTSPVWSAANHGRDDTVRSAEQLLMGAQRFALAGRGKLPHLTTK